MTNGSILLTESKANFSPISQVHYEFYANQNQLLNQLQERDDLESIVGQQLVPFGKSNFPDLSHFEKGINTIDFLNNSSTQKKD